MKDDSLVEPGALEVGHTYIIKVRNNHGPPENQEFLGVFKRHVHINADDPTLYYDPLPENDEYIFENIICTKYENGGVRDPHNEGRNLYRTKVFPIRFPIMSNGLPSLVVKFHLTNTEFNQQKRDNRLKQQYLNFVIESGTDKEFPITEYLSSEHLGPIHFTTPPITRPSKKIKASLRNQNRLGRSGPKKSPTKKRKENVVSNKRKRK
jgi:hypothetical protein